ncbi:30S ribosomal protein S3 [Candidatus Pacearchaeota archaeon]|nr:30S ribosomal protein S3 [Candidatus Pacearchaeota archaeon]
MKEQNTVQLKKEEFAIRTGIKKLLGKGKISKVRIEYTPVGEKIIIATHKPGLVIGRKGERIEEMTKLLKTKFKLENPYIEIEEVTRPEFDAQIMADEIALSLERFGPLKFKVTAYRTLQRIIKAGAKGVEIRLNGKLPGKRAKQWRFAEGYLKKTGEPAKLVDKAQAKAETKPGTVGVKVSILSPDVILKDQIIIDDALIKTLKENSVEPDEVIEKIKKTKKIAPPGVPQSTALRGKKKVNKIVKKTKEKK